MLSGDISLNNKIYNHHPQNLKELCHLHLNVNSLLPKIDQLRYIPKLR